MHGLLAYPLFIPIDFQKAIALIKMLIEKLQFEFESSSFFSNAFFTSILSKNHFFTIKVVRILKYGIKAKTNCFHHGSALVSTKKNVTQNEYIENQFTNLNETSDVYEK